MGWFAHQHIRFVVEGRHWNLGRSDSITNLILKKPAIIIGYQMDEMFISSYLSRVDSSDTCCTQLALDLDWGKRRSGKKLLQFSPNLNWGRNLGFFQILYRLICSTILSKVHHQNILINTEQAVLLLQCLALISAALQSSVCSSESVSFSLLSLTLPVLRPA